MLQNFSTYLFLTLVLTACNYEGKKPPDRLKEGSMNTASFGFDKKFLLQYDSNLVQLSLGHASILISPKYQAKVFTSTAEGDEGKSFGWINYKAFSVPLDPHMNAYGGENRMWLGPEGGPFSLFFEPEETMEFKNWKTPRPFDVEPWVKIKSNDESVLLRKDMRLTNYKGNVLAIRAERNINIESREQIEATLQIVIPDSVSFVGYATTNSLRNIGDVVWNDSTGVPCIWILDMFNPSPSTTIVIPSKPAETGARVATTDYFGEIGKSRLKITDTVIFFKADGKKRGKMGVLPAYAMPLAGSYDAANQTLTITHFTVDNNAKYLNQVWSTTNPVYSGDAMNAYNDGPLEDGSQMGPFYEIESVSPAAMLAPNETIVHNHNVYHFRGSEQYLDSIAIKTLGVDLRTINRALRN